MNDQFITINSDCLTINEREYRSQLSFSSSRICSDKKIELAMKQEYSGRELYEMIQNADDEGSPKIELILTQDNHFHIKNWGDRPFTERGLLSIMRSFLSTKTKKSYKNSAEKPIGNKGLGFRSLLNWSDEIVIHSNGVECSFSEEISRREWNKIKNEGLRNGALTQDDLLSFEEDYEGLPLPILSIPQISKDDITIQGKFDINGVCTTDIEVLCKDISIISDIEQKLLSLPCSVLLFLRNIENIIINCKGKIRTINRLKPEIKEKGFQIVTVIENDNFIRFAVNKYISEDHSFEVGVAFPLSTIEFGRYLYSYFPTKLRMNVPAIFHGTFALDSSRNYLVDSPENKLVLAKLGEVAVQLSCYLVEYDLVKEDKWSPFAILNIENADLESAGLSLLADSIKNCIENAPIIPIVNSKFSSISSVIRLGEKMAKWLSNPIISNTYSDNRLSFHIIDGRENVFLPSKFLSDYVSKKILRKLDDDDIKDAIEDIARKKMSNELRANFIDALIECGIGSKKLDVLVDANSEIIEGQAYILSMAGNPVFPKCLNIKSVDSDLIEILQKKWKQMPIRSITDKLQKITNVVNGDHSAIRKKIESWSQREMNYDGMQEVLKWVFENQSKDATGFSSDLCLINRIGERTKACNLILDEPSFQESILSKIDDKWILKDTLSEWIDTLGAKSPEDVKYFIYKVIGVSRRVPVEPRYFGNDTKYLDNVRDDNSKKFFAHYYCDKLRDRNSNIYNYTYISNEEFFRNLDLSEALGLILTDDRFFDSIERKNIYLYYNGVREETVKYSYAAYILRTYKIFLPLQSLVINSNVFDSGLNYNYLENELNFSKTYKINPLLVSLGAQTKLRDCTIEQLYTLLSQEGNHSGIQKRYRELRDAIKNFSQDEESLTKVRTKFLTHVWARKKSKLEWLPVENVYYWDNDQLPQTILSELPKLEIGSRVGEESVAKIFGIKLAKNISITFIETKSNEDLSIDLRKYISERIKYFLAYRIGDDVQDLSLITQSVKSLRKLCDKLHIYTQALYTIDDKPYQMKNGDILTSSDSNSGGMHYHICSNYPNCVSAISDPAFCESLNEAVCMALKVSSDTMTNYFRNIITNNVRYVDYITRKDISPETLAVTLKSLGLSEKERNFWKSYSDTYDSSLNISQIEENADDLKNFLINKYPNIDLPEVYSGIEDLSPLEQYRLLVSLNVNDALLIGENGLKSFYMEYFKSERDKYEDQYKSFLYHQYSKNISDNGKDVLYNIEEYKSKCQKFTLPFYETKADEIKNALVQESDLESYMREMLVDLFGFSLDVNYGAFPNSILPSYEKILNEFNISEGNLDQTDILIAKFAGLDSLFRDRIRKYIKESQCDTSFSISKSIVIETAKCHSVLKNIHSEINRQHPKLSQRGYVSDRVKYNAGKDAEIKTFNAMKSNPLYEDVKGCSYILNKEMGNDNNHYDISYRKKGSSKTEIRYLEVKSMTRNSVTLSCMEYQFALEHCEQYDIAIYHEGKISIIESPFSSKNGKTPLDVQPESWQLTIEWD